MELRSLKVRITELENKVISQTQQIEAMQYPHNPDGYSAGDELKYAISELKAFYHLFPEALVCVSNHTVRYKKKAHDAGIPSWVIRDYHEVLEAPKGWRWEEKHTIDDIDFVHGDKMGAAGLQPSETQP